MIFLGWWGWPILLSPVLGSFLGVLVSRADQPRDILIGRSACEHCGHRLRPRDLVPILSWLLLRGRCRYCDQPIGGFPLAMEFASLCVAVCATLLAPAALVWVSCGLGWSLLTLAATDFRYYRLPDFLTLPLIPAGLVVASQEDPENLFGHVIGGGAGFLVIIGIHYAYKALRGRDGIGLGDAKLFSAAGAWVGWAGLPSVMVIAAVSGLIFALVRRGVMRLPDGDERVPLGAFLGLGLWVIWFSGPIGIG